MGLITCTYCTGIFMCAGLLLQDDEGLLVQDAKGTPSHPFCFLSFSPAPCRRPPPPRFGRGKHSISLQSLNICQWQNKGKTEPESGLLVLISSLRSPQDRATDEQQMQGNRFLPLVLLLSGCLSPLCCFLDGEWEPDFYFPGPTRGFNSQPSSPLLGCGAGSSWTCHWVHLLANALLQNSGRLKILTLAAEQSLTQEGTAMAFWSFIFPHHAAGPSILSFCLSSLGFSATCHELCWKEPSSHYLLVLSLGCSPPANAPFLSLSPSLSVSLYLCLLLCSLPGHQPSLTFPKSFVLPFSTFGCIPHPYQSALYNSSTSQHRVYQPCWSNSDWP